MEKITHSYQSLTGGNWYRGNLHAHTTRSDGRHPPQEVVAAYARRGHDFLMLSDHDVHTTTGDLSRLDALGMVLIPGNEITAHGPHLLHVNASQQVAPAVHRQSVLQEITADPESFAIVCHPNWLFSCPNAALTRPSHHEHTTLAQMGEWVGYEGLEIYNGVTARLDGSAFALDKWDALLSAGRRVWGFANDDSHRMAGDAALAKKPDATPLMDDDVALGWNVVYAREKSLPAIVDALRKGCFYASTGVDIRGIRVEGTKIRLETTNAQRIAAIRETGRRFAQVDGPVMEVELPPEAKYVRLECWGSGEAQAWTQPFFPTAG